MAANYSAFCGGPFIDSELWSKEKYPDVSSCFQDVVFFIAPSLVLLLLSICRIYHLYYSLKSGFRHHWLATVQTIISVCLVLPPLADLFRTIHDARNGYKSYPIDYLTAIIRAIAMIFAGVITQMERRKGGRYFGGLFSYWVALTIGGAFILYSKIRVANEQGVIDDKFRLATFLIHYILVLLQLILSFIPNPVEVRHENASPELKANYASRLTFWWFNDTIIRGYKKPLQESDLFELNDVDKAGAWVPSFERNWNQEMNRLIRKGVARKETRTNVAHVDANANGVEMDNTKANGNGRALAATSASSDRQDKPEKHSLIPDRLPEGVRPSLVKCLAKVFLPSILTCAAMKFVHDACLFVSPVLLKAVIRFVKNPEEPDWRGYVYAALMFSFAILQTSILHQYFLKAMLIGMRLRSTICASVYNKSMKLTSASRRESTVGEIVNLMSVDAQKFMDLMTYLNMVWSAPFQITVSMVMLWQVLGPSVLAGLTVMILLIPLNIFVGNRIKKLQSAQMKKKDKRIKLMSEILNGIKVLKLYAWEESFAKIILGTRKEELNLLKKAGITNAFSSFFWQVAPFLIACSSFAVYVLSDEKNVLDAEKAFVALSLFNIMRFPMAMLPHVVTSLIQVSVSVKRISKFLSLEELSSHQIDRSPNKVNAVSMNDSSFTWKDGADDNPTLKDITVDIRHGELIAVVGVVGCGKSSLISALLGDMLKLQGHVSVSGDVAYVPQQAWIQNATLRDNITFGLELDQQWYDQVIEACALQQDIDMLPAGDLTEIGEKGINLSGGQKQRVSLARAVYSKASIYYLDDPLSAVDAHVGKHIFDRVISHNGLLQGKTRLLVTHGVSFLPQVDTILVLKDGKQSEVGSFQQLLDRKGAFADFLKTYFLEENENLTEEDLEVNAALFRQISETLDENFESLVRDRLASQVSQRERSNTNMSMAKESPRSRTNTNTNNKLIAPDTQADAQSLRSARSLLTVNDVQPSISREQVGREEMGQDGGFGSTMFFTTADAEEKKEQGKEINEGEEESDKLIKAETSEQGKVKLSVFAKYMAAMGWLPAFLVVFFFVLDQGAAMGANIWLSKWADDVNAFNDTSARHMYLGVYASFGLAQGLLAFSAALSLAFGAWWASKRLHFSLLDNILKCPMNFYDTTPTGRILNRFTKDIDTIDSVIPQNIRAFIWCTLVVVATLVVISISTPWFLVVVLPLGIIYVLIQRFYVATSRQLKRIESVNLSPIYSHFDESVQGAATIRAYSKQKAFMEESLRRVDKHQQAYYPNIISNRWLAVRLEFIGSCVVLSSVLLAVISRNMDVKTLTAGIAGLSITYALGVTNTLNWMVRMTSELENNIVSVERIKEYAELPTEAAWIIDVNRPVKGWPTAGAIVFDNYSVRYREGLDLVLKKITCNIKGGERVGICGRTGAGKSSLTLALFRILEGAEGAIYIDDVRIGAIGLHDLRNALTIIPQDPVVFSGTLRMNLDPFTQYTDEKLWQALEQTGLKTYVQSLEEGLEYICSEGGENLSVGQRQLICLARALLRHTKLLILDEATAAVDLETDDLIQQTIRTAFSDCTVLTIAHRLNTIIDYDKIMVLDNGEVKEYAPPQELLADEESIFYSLAKQANLLSNNTAGTPTSAPAISKPAETGDDKGATE